MRSADLRCIEFRQLSSSYTPSLPARWRQDSFRWSTNGFKHARHRLHYLAPRQPVLLRPCTVRANAASAAAAAPQSYDNCYQSIPSHVAVPQQAPHVTLLGAWWAALLLVCTTLICLGTAITAFLLYLRPFLLNLDRATLATEKAALAAEKASEEVERASKQFQLEFPVTLDAIEKASQEFEELGRSVNFLSGGVARSVGQPVRAVRETTSNSMRKVVEDVASLASALTPALAHWRRRISNITASFEANKQQVKQLEAAMEEDEVSWHDAKQQQQDILQALPSAPAPEQGAAAAEGRWQQPGASTSGRQRGPGDLTDAAWQQAMHSGQGVSEALPPGAEPQRQGWVQLFNGNLQLGIGKDGVPAADADSGQQASTTEAALESAHLINDAAAAAEEVADEAARMATIVSLQSQHLNPDQPTNSDPQAASVAAASSPVAPQGGEAGGVTEDEALLLEQLKGRREAAQAVYLALSRAEQAAASAATASGALEEALQRAETLGPNWYAEGEDGWDGMGAGRSMRMRSGRSMDEEDMGLAMGPGSRAAPSGAA